MASGWICPICREWNRDEDVVCANTSRHDADVAAVYENAVAGAAQILANVRARLATIPPRQAAEEAYVPGGPSVDELEARIRALRDRARAERTGDSRSAERPAPWDCTCVHTCAGDLTVANIVGGVW